MAKIATLALMLAFACACLTTGAARGADKTDISGAWDFEVDLSGTQGMPSFIFKQDGEKLTGKYKGQFGEANLTGKVRASEIEFSFELPNGGKAKYTGTLEKDGTMKGNVNYDDQATGTWTAKKKPTP